MTREEIENKLEVVFNNILIGDGDNHTIEVVLLDSQTISGFRIIENNKTYLLGLTQDQRKKQVKTKIMFEATIIPKTQIKTVNCPELELI